MSTKSNYSNSMGRSKFHREFFDEISPNARTGLKVHWTAYIMVNSLLFLINILTGYWYPWHLFPLMSWGIGISIHTLVIFIINKYEMAYVRGFYIHRAVFLTLSGFFLFLNIISGGYYPWAFWPIAVLATGLGEHYVAYKYLKIKKEGYGVGPNYVLWYPGVFCSFLVFVDLFSNGNLNWFWWPVCFIMGIAYVVVKIIDGSKNSNYSKSIRYNSSRQNPKQQVNNVYEQPLASYHERKFCPRCGEECNHENGFCGYCGMKIFS